MAKFESRTRLSPRRNEKDVVRGGGWEEVILMDLRHSLSIFIGNKAGCSRRGERDGQD